MSTKSDSILPIKLRAIFISHSSNWKIRFRDYFRGSAINENPYFCIYTFFVTFARTFVRNVFLCRAKFSVSNASALVQHYLQSGQLSGRLCAAEEEVASTLAFYTTFNIISLYTTFNIVRMRVCSRKVHHQERPLLFITSTRSNGHYYRDQKQRSGF